MPHGGRDQPRPRPERPHADPAPAPPLPAPRSSPASPCTGVTRPRRASREPGQRRDFRALGGTTSEGRRKNLWVLRPGVLEP